MVIESVQDIKKRVADLLGHFTYLKDVYPNKSEAFKDWAVRVSLEHLSVEIPYNSGKFKQFYSSPYYPGLWLDPVEINGKYFKHAYPKLT